MIITGATGTGKSYIACALGQQACRSGYRVAYRRMPRLIEELALAHADGTYTRLLGRLAKLDVLVLDDWGIAPLRDQERRDMLEIIEDRHGARATIITSQLPVENWHDYVGDPTIADALLDRVVHTQPRGDAGRVAADVHDLSVIGNHTTSQGPLRASPHSKSVVVSTGAKELAITPTPIAAGTYYVGATQGGNVGYGVAAGGSYWVKVDQANPPWNPTSAPNPAPSSTETNGGEVNFYLIGTE